jgi:hypothetical protein
MREVHRSGGSTTWVSTSTMGMSEMDVVTEAVLPVLGPQDTDGQLAGRGDSKHGPKLMSTNSHEK